MIEYYDFSWPTSLTSVPNVCSVAFLTGNGLTFAHLASLATMEDDCEILLLHKSLTVAREVIEKERNEVEIDVRTHRFSFHDDSFSAYNN